jgi:hypothetical protein
MTLLRDAFSFASPIGFLLLLPFVGLLVWQLIGRGSSSPIALTGLEYLRARVGFHDTRRKWGRAGLWGVMALGMAVLWAGPTVHSSKPIFEADKQTSYKNIMMLMDVSRSMSVPVGFEQNRSLPGQFRAKTAPSGPDGGKTRFVAAREALMAFVGRFEGERIGLILFSTEPFLARWPTVETKDRFLEVLNDDIGRGSVSQLQRLSSLTNINKALELARSVIMRQEGVKGGAVVMISDAEDDVENMGAAVRNLRKDGIRIYTIGVGMSEEIVERLSKDFEDDPGFRIFRADSEIEIQEAYRLIGNLEESPLSQVDQREFETDLRWFLSLFLAVIGGAAILALETGFHQTSPGRSTVQERGRGEHALRAS